jgi:hypothetical protein
VIGKRGSRLRSSATDKALGGRASRDGPRYLPRDCRMTTSRFRSLGESRACVGLLIVTGVQATSKQRSCLEWTSSVSIDFTSLF